MLTPRRASRQSCRCLSLPAYLGMKWDGAGREVMGRALTARAINSKEVRVAEDPTYTCVKV